MLGKGVLVMHMTLKDDKRTRVVSDKRKKQYWVENSKGKRISRKFRLHDVDYYGPYARVTTNYGMYIYHESVDDIVFWDPTFRGSFYKLSDKLYEVIWPDTGKNSNRQFQRLYNEKGERLLLQYESTRYFSNGMVAFKADGKWGYLDETGKVVLEPIWNAAGDFNPSGLAIVRFRESEKVAVIDKNGVYVLAPSNYSELKFISNDLLVARKDRKEGVITVRGEVIVPIQFDNVEIVDGFFKVRNNNKYGLYDKNGNMVFECIYPEIIETPDKFVVQDFARQEVMRQKNVSKRI